MTLDEAIKHCKEKAKELRAEGEQLRDIGERVSNPNQPYNEPVKDCLDCANEHEQLAEWLEDYKRLLEEKTQGDLISREALKAYAREVMYEKNATTFSLLKVFDEIIDNASTVETSKIEYKAYNEGFKDGVEQGIKLSEKPQGEWIRTGSLGNGNAQYECSNCHYGDKQAESQEVPYCWHCGASMQKGGAE